MKHTNLDCGRISTHKGKQEYFIKEKEDFKKGAEAVREDYLYTLRQ